MSTRYYYNNSIKGFLNHSDNEILGALTNGSVNDINQQTSYAWNVEIQTMRSALAPYAERGSIFMEYNIPRMGKRIDVVTIIDGIVFIWEYKAGGEGFNREAITQVWDYALDLKNFQEGSRDRSLIPILVASDVKDENCQLELNVYEDKVYQPLLINSSKIAECIRTVLDNVPPYPAENTLSEDMAWANSGYSPTPTIVEAAVALFNNHSVADITRHDGDITETAKAIDELIDYSGKNHRKAICFVTGVPGAGKTLIGLQTAINHTTDSGAVYLSGNYPLVEVLQEALARDYIKQDKARLAAEKARGESKPRPAATKKEAKSKVKEFIQMIHHYRDTYLQGIRVANGGLEVVPGYFSQDKNKDKSYVPHEHVVIFDEAQRAWDKSGLSKFLNDKSKGRENLLAGFPYSEPEFLISTIERHSDWGVVICLIGGGQEINHNEAGIQDWMDSINRRFTNWDVYISDKLTGKEYADKDGKIVAPANNAKEIAALHLPMSMRSFRAEKVSLFVHQLLDLNKDKARETLKSLKNYPLVLTRDLETAKEWLRSKARGSERFGLLASSKAERLKAISINVRYQPDFVQWFLAEENDIRSSNCLEDPLTEFKVQGLEIDWACVAWDADLRLDKEHKHWEHFQLRGGTNWQRINKEINRAYQINAYRVLLTRARQGMVIVVPIGDYSQPPDETRNPAWYDGIYNYLKEVGIPEL